MTEKQLIKQVKELVEKVRTTHRYSMSKIYETYNLVFDKKETPQSCSSCLIRKVKELDKWLIEKEKQPKVGKEGENGEPGEQKGSDRKTEEV